MFSLLILLLFAAAESVYVAPVCHPTHPSFSWSHHNHHRPFPPPHPLDAHVTDQQEQKPIPHINEDEDKHENGIGENDHETIYDRFDEDPAEKDGHHETPDQTNQHEEENLIGVEEIEEEEEEDKEPVDEAVIHPKENHFNTGHAKDNRCRGDDSTPCPGSHISICSDQFCDGIEDCPDGTDEENCHPDEKSVWRNSIFREPSSCTTLHTIYYGAQLSS